MKTYCSIMVCVILLFRNLSAVEVSQETVVDVYQLPCTCDLLEGKCETYCCCDPDCSMREWQCEESPPHHPLLCRSSFNYYDFLCVHKSNSPFLGFLYQNVKSARRPKEFKALTPRAKHYKFELREKPPFDMEFQANKYLLGDAMAYDLRGDRLRKPILLPVPSPLGDCVSAKPLRFLKDQDIKCSQAISVDSCKPDAVWNRQPEFLWGNVTQVDLVTDLSTEGKTVRINFKFFCASDGDQNIFVRTKNVTKLNPPRASKEAIDVEKLSEKIRKSIAEPSNLKECSKVAIAYKDGVCLNVVSQVHLDIYWKDGVIRSADARIVYMDIPVSRIMLEKRFYIKERDRSKVNIHFTRSFKASFVHVDDDGKERGRQSGYRRGSSLATSLESSVGGEAFLGVWKPDSSGLCSRSSVSPVQFGVDVYSTCKILLTVSQLQNCTRLRQEMGLVLESLMSAQKIATTPDRTVSTPIHRSSQLEANGEGGDDTCESIPSGLMLNILHTDRTKQNLHTILHAKITVNSRPWSCRSSCAVDVPVTVTFEEIHLPKKSEYRFPLRMWLWKEFQELLYPLFSSPADALPCFFSLLLLLLITVCIHLATRIPPT